MSVWRRAAAVLAGAFTFIGVSGAPAMATPAPGDPAQPPRADSSPPAASAPRTFVDVGADNAFREEIEWLGHTTISRGWEVPGNRHEFRPADRVSREAMAAFLYRLAQTQEVPSVTGFSPAAEATFTDVPTDHAFYIEISWLTAAEITTGYNAEQFKPRAPISREAMGAFMYRYADHLGPRGPAAAEPASPLFRDVPNEHVFYDEITWMATQGITTGYTAAHGCMNFKPRAHITREAMAAFMYRFVNGGVPPIQPECAPPPPPPAAPARPTTQAVFSYGTLMKGQPAARFFTGAYESYTPSSLNGADMYYSSSRNFPFIVMGGQGVVTGELYNLYDSTAEETINRIDAYERYDPSKPDAGQAYVRTQHTIKQGYTAWVYVAGPEQAAWLKSNGTRIPSGDWLRK